MTYNEICKILNFNKKENSLFLPNEIFEDYKKYIANKTHIPVAYSYSYIVTWLYRYAKYFNTEEIIDNKKIKEILGYSPNNQSLDYLFKKNGLLDHIGYFESVRDYPVSWHYSETVDEELSFFMSSEIDEELKDKFPIVPKRFFLKRPVKAFDRFELAFGEDGSEEEYEMPGTFSYVGNTHLIEFEIFLFCMTTKNIGCVGFYLYSFISQKNDHYKEGYDASIERLERESGIPSRTIIKYLRILRSYKMIDVTHNQEFFVINMPKGDRKANTYTTRDHAFFSDDTVPYKRMGVISEEKYAELLKERVEISDSVDQQMPF